MMEIFLELILSGKRFRTHNNTFIKKEKGGALFT